MNQIEKQYELEKETSILSRDKMRERMAENEKKGGASNNPYSNKIIGMFIMPLIDIINREIKEASEQAGRKKAYLSLLRGLDVDTASYIAVRTSLSFLMSNTKDGNLRDLCTLIGDTLQNETVMRQFADLDEKSFFYLQERLKSRGSINETYRITLVNKEIRSHGEDPVLFGNASKQQLGAYFVEVLQVLGMIEINRHRAYRGRFIDTVEISDGCLELINEIKDLCQELMPIHMPMITQPDHWNSPFGGGYLSREMKKLVPACIQDGNAGNGDVTELLNCINALQDTKWKINTQVLETVKDLVRNKVETEELISTDKRILPEKLDFMLVKDKEEFNEEELNQFKIWKKECTEIYNQKKQRKQKFNLMSTSIKVASKLKDEEAIHFVYFADFRGRVYPRTLGISPQGSDLQKALITFSEGKALASKEAVEFFKIHIANSFGIDKVSFTDRIKWVEDNETLIISSAENPVDDLRWLEADSPFIFLAACFEYRQWKNDKNFLSHIPISFDGTCNGLQNFSALLRDEVGGKATNLIDADKPSDVYKEVADKTTDIISNDEILNKLHDKAIEKVKKILAEDNGVMARKWLASGITRKVVKRPVMTRSYGCTPNAVVKFILKDYLNVERPSVFLKNEYKNASKFLGKLVWIAMNEVIVKANEVMQYLQDCTDKIIKAGFTYIEWKTPTGFIVRQNYYDSEELCRVRVSLLGGMQFRIFGDSKAPSIRKHKQGTPPNFNHSQDASHMCKTTNQASAEGIKSLAMIHDSFGTHAADCPRFFHIIREEFVKMYENYDSLYSFVYSYVSAGVELDDPPEEGSLNIKEVLKSKYFFS